MRYLNLLVVLFILVSCSTESTPVYQLTTSSNPTEGGTVSPASGEYDDGEQVSITASPNENWVFQQWQGGLSGSENPASVTMDSDKSITALFVKREYPLTINIEGEGTVSEEILQQKSTDYPHGTVVELTANPSEGWEFVEWFGDLSGSDNPQTIKVTKQSDVNAVFQVAEYTVDISVDGDGSYSISPDKESYSFGEQIEIAVNPGEGWNFVHWDGNLEGTENPISLSIEEDVSVTAVLDNSPFAGGDGSEMYPYQISSFQQLQQIHDFTFSNFIQIKNIDANESKYLNDGKGFKPIGDTAVPFQGHYEGNNLEIINLFIKDEVRAGLFAEIGENGRIENLTLRDINYSVHAGGGLAGNNYGLIKNCTVSGNIEAKSNGQGGVVGSNFGIIDNVKSTVNLFTKENIKNPVNAVGGIAGGNYAQILNSESSGVIQGNSSVGGISGFNSRLISNSFFRGKISGGSNTGGITGHNTRTIENSGAEAKIFFNDGRYALGSDFGGLAGENSGSINKSHYIGEISGQFVNVGGIVGTNEGRINDSYANSKITGANTIGGAIGRNIENAEIHNVYSLGDINGNEKVGGLIGINTDDATVNYSFSTVKVSANNDLGGFVGLNGASIQDSYWNIESSSKNNGIGRGSSEGVTGLNTPQMHGSAAQDNMPEFDWESVWKTVEGDYPILRWQEE